MKIHYWFHTALMIIWIIFGLLTLINWGFLTLLAFTQIIVGIAQFISSTILVIRNKVGKKRVNIHWFGSIILIGAIVLATTLKLNDVWIRVLIFGAPWILALYFWYLCKLLRDEAL